MSETGTLDAGTALFAAAAIDPLLCNTELPLRGVYYPRGFALEVTTNSPEVLAAAQESWGYFPRTFSEPPLQLRVGVMGNSGGVCPPMPTCRAWQNLLLTIADVENFSVCDLRRGIAFCWLTPAAVANTAYLRYNFLESSALCMLGQTYLVAIHAACVKSNNRGVLLCGDSGAGKSSLSYACALRGWTFIADDASSLVRGRNDLTIVGNPNQIRFREAGATLFPELRRQRLSPRGTGEFSIELATETVPEISTALTASVDYVVFLNRRDCDPPGLVSFPKSKASAWFESVICFGEKEVRQSQVASLRNLMTKPVLELRYRDLDWAVSQLNALVEG